MKSTANNHQHGVFMNKKSTIAGTAEAWETGELGRSDAHVRKTAVEVADKIDEALGLQAISIRLPKATIDTYKQIAEMHGVGYQPLMRDAICRWAESELKMLLIGAVESQRTASKAKKATKQEHVIQSEPMPMKKAA
ncbi:MAG: hypothetical protein PHH58_13715 [Rhodoferax sp.]|nr:hypothetical protein [Rhodoferax sp.]